MQNSSFNFASFNMGGSLDDYKSIVDPQSKQSDDELHEKRINNEKEIGNIFNQTVDVACFQEANVDRELFKQMPEFTMVKGKKSNVIVYNKAKFEEIKQITDIGGSLVVILKEKASGKKFAFVSVWAAGFAILSKDKDQVARVQFNKKIDENVPNLFRGIPMEEEEKEALKSKILNHAKGNENIDESSLNRIKELLNNDQKKLDILKTLLKPFDELDPSEKKLYYNIALNDAQGGAESGNQEVENLAKRLKTIEKECDCVLIGGDFNAMEDRNNAERLQILEKEGYVKCKSAAPTANVSAGTVAATYTGPETRELDYFYVKVPKKEKGLLNRFRSLSKSLTTQSQDLNKIDPKRELFTPGIRDPDKNISDHRPIYMRVDISRGKNLADYVKDMKNAPAKLANLFRSKNKSS